MGDGIGVPLRNGIKQQQLQGVHVGQGVQAVLQEFLAKPLPMALMDVLFAHDFAP